MISTHSMSGHIDGCHGHCGDNGSISTYSYVARVQWEANGGAWRGTSEGRKCADVVCESSEISEADPPDSR